MKIKLIGLAMAIILSGSAFADVIFFNSVIVSKSENECYKDIHTGAIVTMHGIMTLDGAFIEPDSSGETGRLVLPDLNGKTQSVILHSKDEDGVICHFVVSNSQTIQEDDNQYMFQLNVQPVLSIQKI